MTHEGQRVCRVLVVLGSVVALGLVMPAAHAAGEDGDPASAVTTTSRQDMTGVLPNTCAGDIFWTLRFHTTESVRTDAQGGFHYTSRFNVSGFAGQTAAGDEYSGTHAGNWSYNVNCGETGCQYPMEMFFVSTLRLSGHGVAPDLTIKIRQRIVVNANGTTTRYIDLADASCG